MKIQKSFIGVCVLVLSFIVTQLSFADLISSKELKDHQILDELTDSEESREYYYEDIKFKSACKDNDMLETTNNESKSKLDCVRYRYNGKTLKIVHKNAGVNCGAESLILGYKVKNNTIEIREKMDEGTLARCNCVRNLKYKIGERDEIAPGRYSVIIYDSIGKTPLKFSVDLTEKNRGIRCMERKVYPWF